MSRLFSERLASAISAFGTFETSRDVGYPAAVAFGTFETSRDVGYPAAVGG
jgi:hypothetical protein